MKRSSLFRWPGSSTRKSRKPRFGIGSFALGAILTGASIVLILLALPARPIAASGFAVCGQLVGVTITYSDGTVKEASIGDPATTEILSKLEKGHKLLLGAPAPACIPARPQVY